MHVVLAVDLQGAHLARREPNLELEVPIESTVRQLRESLRQATMP